MSEEGFRSSDDYLLDYDNFIEDLWIPSENPQDDMVRCGLALSEEAGEAAGKLKKRLRGDDLPAFSFDMALELGDVLFYVTKYAHLLGYTLGDIARLNNAKLTDRKNRHAIKGSGDSR